MDLTQAVGLPDPEADGRRYVCISIVMAIKADFDFRVKTATGVVSGKAGDYIIKDDDGDWAVVSRKKFEDKYKPAKEGSPIVRMALLYGT
jgi:hypothetical protein